MTDVQKLKAGGKPSTWLPPDGLVEWFQGKIAITKAEPTPIHCPTKCKQEYMNNIATPTPHRCYHTNAGFNINQRKIKYACDLFTKTNRQVTNQHQIIKHECRKKTKATTNRSQKKTCSTTMLSLPNNIRPSKIENNKAKFKLIRASETDKIEKQIN